MELQLEKEFSKTINQTTQLNTCHKANKESFLNFVSGQSVLEILSLCSKNPSTRLEDSSILFKSRGNGISDTQFDFSAADTCNCVSVRSKAKQKLVVPAVERETSKESTSVTESGGETEPSEFSLCSELAAAAFPVSDKSPAHSTFQYQ